MSRKPKRFTAFGKQPCPACGKQVWGSPPHSMVPGDDGCIEQLFDGPYVELFARRQRSGWLCLGNEIDGLDIRDSLQVSRQGGGE